MAAEFGNWLDNALRSVNSKVQAEILSLCWAL